MLSVAIRAGSAFVRCCRSFGFSITPSSETHTIFEPSKYTPTLRCFSNPDAPCGRGMPVLDQKIQEGSAVALTLRTQLKAMKDWYYLRPELFKKAAMLPHGA